MSRSRSDVSSPPAATGSRASRASMRFRSRATLAEVGWGGQRVGQGSARDDANGGRDASRRCEHSGACHCSASAPSASSYLLLVEPPLLGSPLGGGVGGGPLLSHRFLQVLRDEAQHVNLGRAG